MASAVPTATDVAAPFVVPNVELKYVRDHDSTMERLLKVCSRFGPMLLGVFVNMILYGVRTSRHCHRHRRRTPL